MAQTVSAAYLAQLANGLRWARAYIHVINDNIDIYDDTHLIEYKIQTQSQNEKNLFGNAIAKVANIKLQNPGNNTYDLVGKRIAIYAGLTLDIGEVTESVEYVHQGIFRVYDSSKDTDNQSITLDAYDDMVRFNVPYIDGASVYPMSLSNFVSELCTSVGLELGSTTFTNSTFMIEQPNVADNEYNSRALLAWAAQLAVSNAVMGIDNKVYIKSLGASSSLTITPELYYSFKQEPTYGPINFVEMTREALGDTIDYPEPSPESIVSFKIVDNMLAYNQREDIIDNIYTAVNGTSYVPFKLNWRGSGHLEFMDKITITDSNSVSYVSYVLNSVLTFNGALNEELTALAYTGTETSVKNVGSVRQSIKLTDARVDKIEGTITLLAASDAELSGDFAQIELDMSGISQTVGTIVDDLNEETGRIGSVVKQTAANLTITFNDLEELKTYYQYNVNGLTIGRNESPAQITIGYEGDTATMTLTDGFNDTAKIQSNTMTINNIIINQSTYIGNHKVQKLTGSSTVTIFLPV